jgi:hypothetical protein
MRLGDRCCGRVADTQANQDENQSKSHREQIIRVVKPYNAITVETKSSRKQTVKCTTLVYHPGISQRLVFRKPRHTQRSTSCLCRGTPSAFQA